MPTPMPRFQQPQVELSDAFIDLMHGAAALADDELNELEQRLHDDITEALAGKLSTEQIPHLPTTAYALLSRLHDPEVTADELISLVKDDPALSAEMVRLANSALFRRGDREVTNLKQATLTVGFNGLRSMVLTSLMQPVLNIRPIYFKLFGQQLWEHSIECAMACAAIAKRREIDTFNAYLLGLIHDVGKIVLFQMLVEALRVIDPDIKPRPYVLVKLILTNSRRLSVEVAKAWQLPAIYQEALRAHAEKSTPARMPPLGRLLFYGNLLGEAHLALRRGRLPTPAVERLLAGFDLNLEMVRILFPDAPPASRSAA